MDDKIAFPVDAEEWRIFVEVADDLASLTQIERMLIKSCEFKDFESDDTTLILHIQDIPSKFKAKRLVVASDRPVRVEVASPKPIPLQAEGAASVITLSKQ